MFGLDFLFSAALFALPLAAIPIILHLLFRKKSPVVQFSTLRFIKSSLQRTAARKKVQRWTLLAVRAGLLLLLIWAVAQPARIVASGWFGKANAPMAAIVVDTSYSMLLEDQQISLLNRATSSIEDLLRGPLANASVAIFRSRPEPADHPEQLKSAADILSQWVPLSPQATNGPLVNRINSAIDLLKRQDSDQRWLIVLTDFQSKEFPRPLPDFDGRVVLIDLHPDEVRNGGITRINIEPEQFIAGIGVDAVVQLSGRIGDTRACIVKVESTDGNPISQSAPQIATFDGAGRATLRFPIKPADRRWQKITAQLSGNDAMTWDDSRSLLVEIPPKQPVALVNFGAPPGAGRAVKLALDPSEGAVSAWPIGVSVKSAIGDRDSTIVALLNDWPDEANSDRLRQQVRAGGTAILFLNPGMEDSFGQLSEAQKKSWQELLPGSPTNKTSLTGAYRGMISSMNDPLMLGFTDERFQLGSITTRRFLPFGSTDGATTILSLTAVDASNSSRPQLLLAKKQLGSGRVFCWSVLPDPRSTNLATHPLFLPLLVRMCLPPAGQSGSGNFELGQNVVLINPELLAKPKLQILGPQRELYSVNRSQSPAGNSFVFEGAVSPGIYTWQDDANQPVAQANLQLPADETSLAYKPAATLAAVSENVVVARSVEELTGKLTKLSEPESHWHTPLALVLVLLCVEAFLGSASQLWKARN